MPINRYPPLRDTVDPNEQFDEQFHHNADAADLRGVYIQNDTSDDASVLVTRDASDNLTFQDVPNSTPVTLSTLAGKIDATQHETLRQLIHLADGVGGPMEGWASGAYRETLPSASPFPTQIIWWTDNTKTKKIVQKSITFNTNKTPATVAYAVYQSDGVTVIATVTDTMTYSGVFETNRTRVVT